MLVAKLASKAVVVQVASAALREEQIVLPLERVPGTAAQIVELRAEGLRETVCVEIQLCGVPTDEGCPVQVRPLDDIGYGELLAFVARNEALLKEAPAATPDESPRAEEPPVPAEAEEVAPPAAPEEPAHDEPAEPPPEAVMVDSEPPAVEESAADEPAAEELAGDESTEAAPDEDEEADDEAEGPAPEAFAVHADSTDAVDSYDTRESVAPESGPSGDEDQGVALADEDSGFMQFFGGLTAAVARTGYYDKDHPEVVKQINPLGQATRKILEGRGELSIVRRGMGDKAELVIWEPITGEALGLDELLPMTGAASMGERMTEFFVRRRLMALTLKAGIKDKELVGVLDLLSGAEAEVADLREQFLTLSLDYVSALFEEDRLGVERTLPWHVELCISRVARDLRALPIFRGADDETIRRMRVQLVADVVRPLQDPNLLAIMLENSDLIAEVLDKSEDTDAWFDPAEVICEALAQPVAVKVAGTVLDRLEEEAIARSQGDAQVTRGSSTQPEQLIKLLAGRFINDRSLESDEVLRELHGRAVLSFKELPPDLRLWIRAGGLCDDLVANLGKALMEFENFDESSFSRSADVLARAVQILAQRDELVTLGALFDWLVEHANRAKAGTDSRQGNLARVRDQDADAELLEPMGRAFLTGDSRLREVAHRMLIFAEHHGAEALCRARRQLEDDAVHRPRFVSIMRELGDSATPAVARSLAALTKNPSARDANVEDLLRSLPIGPHGKAGACAAHFLHHSNDVGVRRAASAILPELWGDRANDYLSLALKDPDDGVVIGAFRGLRKLGGVNAEAVAVASELLNATSGASDELLASAATAIGDPSSPVVDEAREVLIDAIQEKSRGILNRLKGVPISNESPLAVESIARALMELGGEREREALSERAKSARGDVKRVIDRVQGA